MPIDSFLKTLAEVQGSRAIGVILSGMGSDGTLGLQAIEAGGGIAFAQQPASAKSGDMPRSAITAGGVDFVLTPEEIARELTRLGRHPYLAGEPAAEANEEQAAGAPEDGREDDHEGLARILELLRKASGTDFSAYKKTTLRRRIARRMAVRCTETFGEYARLLEGDVAEAAALYEDCLISVTSFFRDPQVFQALSEQVLPLLLNDRPAGAPVRVWVPGCATGEEVYSIAMCLLERTAELSRNPSLQIFATDLSEGALAKARAGPVPGEHRPRRLARAPAPLLHQGRRPLPDQQGHPRDVRLRAPRPDAATRRTPASTSSAAATSSSTWSRGCRRRCSRPSTTRSRPDGFLVVGPAETAGASSALFAAVDETHRIYSRKATIGPPRFFSGMRDAMPVPGRARRRSPPRPQGASEVSREADRMLLARFQPAGVVVDAGPAHPRVPGRHGSRSSSTATGQASLNLERLLRKGLLMEVRQAIDEARRKETPVRRQGLQVRYHEQLRTVSVEVVPIKGRAAAERVPPRPVRDGADARARAERRASSRPLSQAAGTKDQEIARLGQALAETTEYLHTLVREHEAALEELQSTNEEALSSNEELQSVNEELQTAKEEIQSANEELATLNQELQDRNTQLARSNDEIQRALDSANAIVDTVRQPLVILDRELRVEKANAAFYDTLPTTGELTRGRLLSELGSGQWDKPALLTALEEVLDRRHRRWKTWRSRPSSPPSAPARCRSTRGASIPSAARAGASSWPSKTARRSSGPSARARLCSRSSTTPASGPRRRTTSRTSSWPPSRTSCAGRSPSSRAG